MSFLQSCAEARHCAAEQQFPALADLGKPCRLEKLAGRVGASLAYAFFLSLQRCSCVHLTTADELDLLGLQKQQQQQRRGEEGQEQEPQQRKSAVLAGKPQEPECHGDEEEEDMEEEEDLDALAQLESARCLCMFPRSSPLTRRRVLKSGRPLQLPDMKKKSKNVKKRGSCSHAPRHHAWTLAMVSSKQHFHSMERFV